MFEWFIASSLELMFLAPLKIMFTELLLDKEMDDARSCR